MSAVQDTVAAIRDIIDYTHAEHNLWRTEWWMPQYDKIADYKVDALSRLAQSPIPAAVAIAGKIKIRKTSLDPSTQRMILDLIASLRRMLAAGGK